MLASAKALGFYMGYKIGVAQQHFEEGPGNVGRF